MPATDAFFGLERCLEGRFPALAKVFAGLLIGWWLYVPVHELLHAFGCLATGGTVSRLEVAPLYGGHLLAMLFPWVVAGGEYAGRLAGFDTGGNDLIYLATDLAPFLLTLVPGVWWLRRAARRGQPLQFGLSLPVALAPFTSLPGDAYEIGSILVTRLPPWGGARQALLRGDDLLLKAEQLGAAEVDAGVWLGYGLAALLGLLWALVTYGAGAWLATRAGQPALTALPLASAKAAAAAQETVAEAGQVDVTPEE